MHFVWLEIYVKVKCMCCLCLVSCIYLLWTTVRTVYSTKIQCNPEKQFRKKSFPLWSSFFFCRNHIKAVLLQLSKVFSSLQAVVLNYFRIEVCSFVLPVFSTIQYTVWFICFWKSFWKTTLKKMLTSPMSGLPCILHWVCESLLRFGLQDQRSCSPLHLEFTVTLCEQHWLNTCNKKQISMFSPVSFCYPKKIKYFILFASREHAC